MNKARVSIIAATLGLTALLVSGQAAAVTTTTWNWPGTVSDTEGGVTGTLAGYSSSGVVNNLTAETPVYYGASYGWGVCSSGEDCQSPQHAMDNDGRRESLLVTFASQQVKLTDIQLGWAQQGTTYGSADISVVAYVGSGSPTMTGISYTGISTSADWKVIGNYANVAPDANLSLGNTTVYSSFWLIAAYNPVFGTCTGCERASGNYDYAKLYSVTGSKSGGDQQVSEPSSMALLGISMLIGTIGLRRRQNPVAE
jgi:hypothetical protein